MGLGSFWKFPKMVLINGGFAIFIIPYTISYLLVGLPLLFVELTVGSRFQKGTIGVARSLSSRLVGVGYAQLLIGFISVISYLPILTHVLYYLGLVITGSELVSSKCDRYNHYE